MNFNRNHIEELIQYLQGTCKTLDEAMQDILGNYDSTDLSEDNTEQIDNEIFLCASCGWWYEVCDMSDVEEESTCNDCNE